MLNYIQYLSVFWISWWLFIFKRLPVLYNPEPLGQGIEGSSSIGFSRNWFC